MCWLWSARFGRFGRFGPKVKSQKSKVKNRSFDLFHSHAGFTFAVTQLLSLCCIVFFDVTVLVLVKLVALLEIPRQPRATACGAQRHRVVYHGAVARNSAPGARWRPPFRFCLQLRAVLPARSAGFATWQENRQKRSSFRILRTMMHIGQNLRHSGAIIHGYSYSRPLRAVRRARSRKMYVTKYATTFSFRCLHALMACFYVVTGCRYGV